MLLNCKYILIVVLILLSCDDTKNIAIDLSQLQSKPITLPETCEVIADGRDTSITNILISNLKLVVYVDSVGCSLCSISKMYLWEGFIEYAKPFSNQLKYYFIYSPAKKDINDIKMALRNNMFDYPVLIDEKGDFERLNPHLPKNKQLHTFLLDENNNVILVGNPLNNKEVEKLFYAKTQELLHK